MRINKLWVSNIIINNKEKIIKENQNWQRKNPFIKTQAFVNIKDNFDSLLLSITGNQNWHDNEIPCQIRKIKIDKGKFN